MANSLPTSIKFLDSGDKQEFKRDIGLIINHLETFKVGEKRISYQNRRDDPGNFQVQKGKPVNIGTKFGIAGRFHPQIKTAEQMKNLTRAEAERIYYKEYWRPLQDFNLPQRLKALALDMSITVGSGTTRRYLSKMSESRDLTDQTQETKNFNTLAQLRFARAISQKHTKSMSTIVKTRVPKAVKVIMDNIPKNPVDGMDLSHPINAQQ